MKLHASVLLTIFLAVHLNSNAQGFSDTTGLAGPHHLLWFKGHWNSKTSFAIDKDSTFVLGGTINITPDNKIEIQSQGQDEWNKRVDEALQKIENWESQLTNPGDNIDLTTHHLNETLQPVADDAKKEWTGYKIDETQDLLSSGSKNNITLASIASSACEKYKPMYDEIMQYYNTHRHDKDADLQNPSPPQFDYTCFACDSQARKDNDTIVAHFVRDFPHPEDKYIREGLMIAHDFALMGIDTENGMGEDMAPLFHHDKKDPSKSGPCAYLDLYKLNEAVINIASHYYRRAEKLLHDNRKNYKAAWAVIQTYLSAARDWGLLTGQDDFDSHVGDLVWLVKQNYDYYYNKLSHNDWTQIGNIPFLLTLLRQEALFGSDDKSSDEFLVKLVDIMNNFQLSVEMDVKAGGEGNYMISHLKGKCFIIPDFEKDSNQCYRWVIADDNAKDILGIRKSKKPYQRIDCQIITNEMVTQGPRPEYVGARQYTTDLQRLHMDFCHPGKDTILLTGFSPDPNDNGLWQFPYGIKQNLGINQSDQYFRNIEEMKKLAQSGKAKEQAGNMKEEAEKLKAQMEELNRKMQASNDKMAYYQQIMELAQKMKNLSGNANLAPILYIDFELPVHNNSPELVNNRFDARQINLEISKALVYGYYTIIIENKANGGE
ncbi:MAG TPA: hypothetical protein VIH57_01990 [Bacteroidales bacterium]